MDVLTCSFFLVWSLCPFFLFLSMMTLGISLWLSLQRWNSQVPSIYHHDAQGWHMHTEIQVYNFSWTKSLLWLFLGQREDADCWYFCLFKLFTHSETTLILVCGMLAVGDCGAVWRTDGPSEKPVRKHTTSYDSAAFLSPPNCEIRRSYFITQVTDHCCGKTTDICFKLLFEFLYIQCNTVITEENKPKTPYLFSNQWTQEKKREPHSQP